MRSKAASLVQKKKKVSFHELQLQRIDMVSKPLHMFLSETGRRILETALPPGCLSRDPIVRGIRPALHSPPPIPLPFWNDSRASEWVSRGMDRATYGNVPGLYEV